MCVDKACCPLLDFESMTLALILAISVAVGASIRRWRALLLPLSVGCVSAVVVSMMGHGLRDTPIPFGVAVATMAVAVGVALRPRQFWRSL